MNCFLCISHGEQMPTPNYPLNRFLKISFHQGIQLNLFRMYFDWLIYSSLQLKDVIFFSQPTWMFGPTCWHEVKLIYCSWVECCCSQWAKGERGLYFPWLKRDICCEIAHGRLSFSFLVFFLFGSPLNGVRRLWPACGAPLSHTCSSSTLLER